MAILEYCIGNHQVVLPDLLDSPLLVGVHHELPVPTDGLSHDGTPPDVILHIRPNLQLEIVEPLSHELLTARRETMQGQRTLQTTERPT